ncbi:hypothetical protein F4861DRAFT_492902 [Xylaria intraflava]|nr:hypothetical protein F4861DRAFT_492902 [Xylaria intraflava]
MLAVLEATKCNIWISAGEVPPIPVVNEVLQKRPMNVLRFPPLDNLLDAASVKPFPYTKTFDEAMNDPFCFLHTSGTTGVPKPIPWSHGLIGTMDAVRLLPPVEGDDGLLPWTSDWKAGDTIYSSFPMSHGAGIIMDILMPALYNLHCVLGPANVIPNINLVQTLAESTKIDIWSMVPSLVDELGEAPEVLAKLKSSKFICASGGPVSPVNAGKVNEVIRVLNLTGTTEGLFIGNLVPSREDWFWFCFHPSSGFEFKKVDADTYEHWVHRNEQWPLFQGIFHTFPDKQSINFQDLYMRHPTNPNLWAFKGRSDDLIVLSNGYKISPLETEAYITTHPAIEGCLVVGAGKPQAGLLIELKDASSKSDELLESIWKTVEAANSMSRHKNQLSRDFIMFAEPDKPFCRTDKRTVKRAATLKLYADYIECFYSSLGDDGPASSTVALGTISIKSVQDSVCEIVSSLLHRAQGEIHTDTNLFELGLDSLSVISAVKAIRAATGLGDQITGRNIYANPTIAKLSTSIVRMLAKSKPGSKTTSDEPVSDSEAKMKRMITQHQGRRSFRLNAFDYVHQRNGMGFVFYMPLREGVNFQEAFACLRAGLNRTLDLIPALGGKIMECSAQEVGYTKGDICVSIPPLSMAASVCDRLIYKDLSNILPSFAELRTAGFPPSAVQDSLLMRDDPFPQLPADILVAHANFVTGGCLLAIEFNHGCLDAIGAFVALRAWAENCRYLQGDESATCKWFDPESFNHSLPEIIHEQEGWARPVHEIDPGTWGFLPFFPDDKSSTASGTTPPITIDDKPLISTGTSQERNLPPRPVYPLHSVWPLPRAERCLETTLFRISPGKLEEMKRDVMADPETNGVVPSISDIVQAFFWRAALRARYRVATEIRKQTFGPDEKAILELPTDGRPYFSELLPPTYMGTLMLQNRLSMPIKALCSHATSIGLVARQIHQASALVSPSLVHDAFTILQSLTDHSRFSTAHMGLEHMHTLLSNMMMISTSDIQFGDKLFANGGTAESLRPQIERFNGRFRVLLIFPMTKDGAVELVLGTHPEELEMLRSDDEFTKYATLVGGGY